LKRKLRRSAASTGGSGTEAMDTPVDLFGETDPLGSYPDLATEAQRSSDLFMAELTGVLSRAIR
jgi:hypothetical protein